MNAGAAAQEAVLGKAQGPTIVAKAWTDPAFKRLLLSNAHAAAATLGIDASNPAAPTHLTALENTDRVHHVIVCTLCSCYPQSILGLSPQWYRSRSYRARCVVYVCLYLCTCAPVYLCTCVPEKATTSSPLLWMSCQHSALFPYMIPQHGARTSPGSAGVRHCHPRGR